MRIGGAVPGRVEHVNGRWLWRCTKCGLVAPWNEDWSWFGSYLEAEDNRFEWVACSPGCTHPSQDERAAARKAFAAHEAIR